MVTSEPINVVTSLFKFVKCEVTMIKITKLVAVISARLCHNHKEVTFLH